MSFRDDVDALNARFLAASKRDDATGACAVKRVDRAEAVILRMHERYLLDPAEKIVASQEVRDSELSQPGRGRRRDRNWGCRSATTSTDDGVSDIDPPAARANAMM